jgi:predicted nucleotidyltransferase
MIDSSTGLRLAQQVADELQHDGRVDSIFLSGSLVAGLGTPSSDVDVFVVLKSGQQPVRHVEQRLLSGERVDIEYHTTESLHEVLRSVTEWQLTRRDVSSAARIREADIDLATRLTQIQVVRSSDFLADLMTAVGAGERQLRRLVLAKWAIEAANYLEDFDGAYLDSDWDLLALVGMPLMTIAGKAVAAAAGDLYWGRKWVVRQLRRAPIGDFPLDLYLEFIRGDWLRGDRHANFGKFREFVQTCLVAAQLLGWHEPMVGRWPAWCSGNASVRRDPDLMPLHVDGSVVLTQERTRQFEVQPDVALVWGLSDGFARADAIERAVALRTADPDFRRITPDRAGEMYDKLSNLGLIR